MKKLMRSFLLLLFLFEIKGNAFGQWYLDTANDAEIRLHDQAYHILQKEIETRICNSNWGIPQVPFFYLEDHPDTRLVLRGKSIQCFSFTGSGDACSIKLKETSPEYKVVMDSTRRLTAVQVEHAQKTRKIWDHAVAHNYKISPGEKKILDSMQEMDKTINRKLDALLYAQQFADISMEINANWTTDIGVASKVMLLPPVPGIRRGVLSTTYPDKDRSDTSYYAYLYLGEWQPLDLKKRVLYHFKYQHAYGLADRKHAGQPVIENFKITISSPHYQDLMKVIHVIDWTKLVALIKE
jgi:hypothetical protein